MAKMCTIRNLCLKNEARTQAATKSIIIGNQLIMISKPCEDKMISTIIFDLGDVQLVGLYGIEKRLAPKLRKTEEEIWQGMRGEDLAAFFNGKISEDEYLSRTIKRNAWPLTVDLLKSAIRDNFKEVEGTRKIVEELKEAGYKLGVLSVHGKEWIEYIHAKFDFHLLFDHLSYSYEATVSKPDPLAYKMIMQKFGVRPEECLFIDDIQRNIDAAKALGMHALRFTGASQLREDLAAMGIKLGKGEVRVKA